MPEFVKDEIREQVHEQLRADVTEDVIATAREERWGVKDALPSWVTSMNWSGDFRLRYEDAFFADGNLPSVNFRAINTPGGFTLAGIDAFFNASPTTSTVCASGRDWPLRPWLSISSVSG